MDWNFLFVNILNGVVYGCFLLLTSLGLSLVFGLGRVVNFAHGALYAMGGYALIAVMHAVGAGYWLGLLVAPLLVIPIAMAIERVAIHPIRHRPDVDTLLVTFGLSSMIVGGIEYVWGTGTKLLPPPSPFDAIVDVLGNQYPVYRLAAAIVSLLVSAGVLAVIQFSPVGLRIRAITDDPGMAEALGVNRKRLLTLVFGCAAGLAALAGALGAPIFAVHPLGAGARPRRHPQATGFPVHRPRCDAGCHSGMVRPPLVQGDHVPGDPRASRRRDPAPVVRSRHRAHHAGAVGPLLHRHPLGRRSQSRGHAPSEIRRLVRQGRPDLQRRHRRPTRVSSTRRGKSDA